MVIFKALLLFAGLAFSQEGSVQIDHFLGLNDTKLPATLNNFQAQDLLNTESSLDGTSIKKRSGFSKEASLTIATGPVTGSHYFVDGSGNQVTLICQDRNCARSLNNGAYSVFLTTASAGVTRWQWVDINGTAYGVNDQRMSPIAFTGGSGASNFSFQSTMPQGTLIELTKDRLAIAGTSANPNRVSLSASGNYTSFTTGPLSSDAWTEDFGTPGDAVSAIKYALDKLLIFKRSSIIGCLLGDQYTTKCYPISNVVGTTDPGSVVIGPGGIYFRSQDRTFWKLTSYGLEPISQEIRTFVATQNSGSTQSNLQYTQGDWQAGIQNPTGSWNTTNIAGTIMASSVTFSSLGLRSTDWAMVDVDTTVLTTAYVSNSDGSSLDSIWTLQTGNIVVDSSHMMTGQNQSGLVENVVSTPITQSSGVWSFVFLSTDTNCDFEYFFAGKSSATDQTAIAYAIRFEAKDLIKINGTPASISQLGVFGTNYCDGTSRTFKISRSTSGYTAVYVDGTLIVSGTDHFAFTPGFSAWKTMGSQASKTHVDTFKFPQFYEKQVSTRYDTGFLSPVFGPYSVSMSSTSTSSVTFTAQSSSDGSTYGALVTQTNGQPLGLTRWRYLRHGISPSPTFATPTSSVSGVSFVATTTGTFVTQCVNTTGMNSTYGILNCSQITSGAATITYASTSTASCSTIPDGITGTWTTVANNSAPTISTNTSTWFRFTDLLGSATEQAQVNSCLLYWTVGTTAQPVWGVYEPIGNSIYWTTSINNSSTTNRTLKYDLNLTQWYPFDLPFAAPKIINSNFYAGGGNGGYWFRYGPTGSINNDNGAAINAYWKSKDFAGASPFQNTTWKRIFIAAKNYGSGSITNTWSDSLGQTSNYNISTSTSTTLPYVRSGYLVPLTSPAPFFNFKLSNSAADNPFEVGGVRIDFLTQPYAIQNP